MSSRANRYASAGAIIDFLHRLEQFSQIGEFARAVGIGKDGVLTSHMAHPVGDGAAFAAVFL